MFPNKEGVVIIFENGERYKLKTDLYVRMHKSKEIVSDDRRVYELILNEEIDDIKPRLLEAELRRVEELEVLMRVALDEVSNQFEELHREASGLTKKEFALSSTRTDSGIRGAIFSMMDGSTSMDEARKLLLKNIGNRNKFENNLKRTYRLNL